MPAFPFHGWMPDGYKAMPLPVLAVFSGDPLARSPPTASCGSCLPLFPDAAAHFQTLMLLIALASILYGSAMAFTTTDARLILGYSSVAQLGFITLGIFSLTDQGAQGALLQSVNHGLVVAPAFFIVALLAAPRRRLGGPARHGRHRLPRAGARRAVPDRRAREPGDAGLVELRRRVPDPARRLPARRSSIAIVAFTGVVLASVYTLRLFIRAMHNRVGPRASSRVRSACATASCSCRSCWRSSRSRCTRSWR